MKHFVITLTEIELGYCLRHATAIVNHYGGSKSKGSGTYNHNKIEGNLVGVKGEVAMSKYLQEHFANVETNYETYTDTHKQGDIQIGGQAIEVKSLRPHHWANYGRMVPPHQLSKYCRNNAIIVWTTATADATGPEVCLQGWNYANDVRDKGIPCQTICENIWLKDNDQMRNMDELVPILKNLQS